MKLVLSAALGCLIWSGAGATPPVSAQTRAPVESTVTVESSITVRFTDGRRVSGIVDPRTDRDRLWLRTTSSSVTLTSGFPWDEVAGIATDTPPQGRRELQAVSYDTDHPEPVDRLPVPLAAPPLLPLPESPLIHSDFCDCPPPGPMSPRAERSGIAGPPRSLDIEAVLASWDNDVEADGLRMFVIPRDARGTVVPVNGLLNLTLTGQAVRTADLDGSQSRQLFPELGRWTRQVRKADFVNGVAVYEIPFRTVHPEFHFGVARYGLIAGRLGVPGRGVFHASRADVDLRPASWFRDQHQLLKGSRFSPREFTRRHSGASRWSLGTGRRIP